MRIKKTLIILAGLFILLAGAQTVLAQKDYGLKKTADTAFGEGKYNKGEPSEIIGNVIGAILTMVGVLFLVLMIYGGVLWMTARGNEQQSQKALNTIIAAVIGLVIVLGSYAVTNFIFSSVQKDETGAGTAGCVVLPDDPNCAGTAASDCSIFLNQPTCTAQDCCVWGSS